MAELAAEEQGAKAADKRAAVDVESIVDGLRTSHQTAILALNKIDGMKRETLLALLEKAFRYRRLFGGLHDLRGPPGAGVDDLKARLAALIPEGPLVLPGRTDRRHPRAPAGRRDHAGRRSTCGSTRSCPYAAAVETTAFEERQDGSARIEQTIYVERESQRPIILGAGGQTLKWIGQKSREELQVLLDRPVHLFLHVKVDERWADKREFYGDVGLGFRRLTGLPHGV